MNHDEILILMLTKSIENGDLLLSQMELQMCVKSRIVLIRSLAAEAIGVCSKSLSRQFVQENLLCLLCDRNKGVRSSAAIGLSEINNSNRIIIESLKQAFMRDIDPLTRGYAGYALIKHLSLCNDCFFDIKRTLLQDRNLFVQAICNGALYEYDFDKNALENVISCFRSKNYRTRCAVANILLENTDATNAKRIICFVEDTMKNEEAYSVIDSLITLKEKAISILNKG